MSLCLLVHENFEFLIGLLNNSIKGDNLNILLCVQNVWLDLLELACPIMCLVLFALSPSNCPSRCTICGTLWFSGSSWWSGKYYFTIDKHVLNYPRKVFFFLSNEIFLVLWCILFVGPWSSGIHPHSFFDSEPYNIILWKLYFNSWPHDDNDDGTWTHNTDIFIQGSVSSHFKDFSFHMIVWCYTHPGCYCLN